MITETEDDTTHVSDWERGYAKGYERALQQLVELIEYHIYNPIIVEMVREQAEKLRKEVLEA